MGREVGPPGQLVVLVDEGPRCRLYAYRGPDGSVPVLEALEAQDSSVQEAYAVRFRRLCAEGPERLRDDQYHKWKSNRAKDRDDIKEFAAFKDNRSKTRIPSFPDGAGVRVLTHLITGKKEDRLDPRGVREAVKIREEYMRRKAALLAGRKQVHRGRGRG